jgi:hypothetical protein
MQNYALIAFDLVKTLVESNPLPWSVITVNGEQTVIATSTKAVMIKTRDPAVASQVVIFANACNKKPTHVVVPALHG